MEVAAAQVVDCENSANSMIKKFEKLKQKYAEISNINSAISLLQWDRRTYMPPMGSEARAEALSALESIAHEKFTSSEIGDLINELHDWANDLNYDSFEASFLRAAKRKYDREVKIPSDFVRESAREISLATDLWTKAKQDSDFSLFAPQLEKIVNLTRQKASYLIYTETPYDALLDLYEPGIKKSDLEPLFSELKEQLISLTEKIKADENKISNDILKNDFGEESQVFFLDRLVCDLGYDPLKGRQDRSVHPFTISMSPADVRITTRINKNYLSTGLYASLHECGHALYDQGIRSEFERTPLAEGASYAIHESQSRFWENIVGRSLPFSKWILPRLKEIFPSQFENTTPEDFYKAVNKAGPSLIRVEADEVTYNLHIILRFEIEVLLIESKISVTDIPDVWNEKMRDYFGIVPQKDSEGVLQDVHWTGSFGYFPSYALGNLISAQIFSKMEKETGDIEKAIEKGRFDVLLNWLRKKIHNYGAKYEPAELLSKSLGVKLSAEPFLEYLKKKYSDLYSF